MPQKGAQSIPTLRMYGAYGSESTLAGAARTRYAGEIREPVSDLYILGDRPYLAACRRFLAPDPSSPFDRGGLNRYAYCEGDPVNRVDPSGMVWSNWVGRLLGDGTSPSRGGTATQAASGGASSSGPAQTTPSMAIAATASSMDTAAAVAAIAPANAAPAPGNQGSAVLGKLASTHGNATPGSAVPAAQKGYQGQDAPGTPNPTPPPNNISKRPRHTVISRPAAEAPSNRFSPHSGRFKTKWAWGRTSANPNSIVWAADTRITLDNLKPVLHALARQGVKKANVYSGAHGVASGDNWTSGIGLRLDSDVRFSVEDLTVTTRRGKQVGVDVTVEHLPVLRKDTLRDLLTRDGVHVMGCCYGIADEVVMDVLGLDEVTVYRKPTT